MRQIAGPSAWAPSVRPRILSCGDLGINTTCAAVNIGLTKTVNVGVHIVVQCNPMIEAHVD